MFFFKLGLEIFSRKSVEITQNTRDYFGGKRFSIFFRIFLSFPHVLQIWEKLENVLHKIVPVKHMPTLDVTQKYVAIIYWAV